MLDSLPDFHMQMLWMEVITILFSMFELCLDVIFLPPLRYDVLWLYLWVNCDVAGRVII